MNGCIRTSKRSHKGAYQTKSLQECFETYSSIPGFSKTEIKETFECMLL